MSLRARLALLYTSIVGGILFLFGMVVYLSVSITLTNEVDGALSWTATQIIREARAGVLGVKLPELDLVYRAQIFPIEGEPLLAAVLVDISEEVRATQEFTLMREAALDRAQEVITRQMKTAQEIAGLLGETTAETKALLVKLMDLARRESME